MIYRRKFLIDGLAFFRSTFFLLASLCAVMHWMSSFHTFLTRFKYVKIITYYVYAVERVGLLFLKRITPLCLTLPNCKRLAIININYSSKFHSNCNEQFVFHDKYTTIIVNHRCFVCRKQSLGSRKCLRRSQT